MRIEGPAERPTPSLGDSEEVKDGAHADPISSTQLAGRIAMMIFGWPGGCGAVRCRAWQLRAMPSDQLPPTRDPLLSASLSACGSGRQLCSDRSRWRVPLSGSPVSWVVEPASGCSFGRQATLQLLPRRRLRWHEAIALGGASPSARWRAGAGGGCNKVHQSLHELQRRQPQGARGPSRLRQAWALAVTPSCAAWMSDARGHGDSGIGSGVAGLVRTRAATGATSPVESDACKRHASGAHCPGRCPPAGTVALQSTSRNEEIT